MSFFLDEGKVAINYNPKFREFSIELKNSNSVQIIEFCPWCGNKLPETLRNTWFDILENEYNIEDPINDRKEIPKLFRTDKWWKDLNL